jgi:hypothetical protein
LPLESTSNVKAYGPSCLRELASQGVLSEVVVAYRDRLCRFAFELIEWLASYGRFFSFTPMESNSWFSMKAWKKRRFEDCIQTGNALRALFHV